MNRINGMGLLKALAMSFITIVIVMGGLLGFSLLLNSCYENPIGRNEAIKRAIKNADEARDEAMRARYDLMAPFYMVAKTVPYKDKLFVYFYEADFPQTREDQKAGKFTVKSSVLYRVEIEDPDLYAQFKEGVFYSSQQPPMMRVVKLLQEVPSFAENPRKE